MDSVLSAFQFIGRAAWVSCLFGLMAYFGYRFGSWVYWQFRNVIYRIKHKRAMCEYDRCPFWPCDAHFYIDEWRCPFGQQNSR